MAPVVSAVATEGVRHAPDGMVERLIGAYGALGLSAVESVTYQLVPVTQSWRHVMRYPERVLCLEVRRDLLVDEYTPFTEMRARPAAADRIASPLADAIDGWLAHEAR